METAQGIVSVVTANMARAIRVISVQRGHDPRQYTLMAFGGAGRCMPPRLARELDMRRVLVPASPGILCAMGLTADRPARRLRGDASAAAGRWRRRRAGRGICRPRPARRALVPAGGHRADRPAARRSIDMRYHGQNYELGIALADGAIDPAALAARFAEAHRQRYGFATDDDPVEIVTLRLEANGVVAEG
jgi:N-methylhydantoinase A